MNHVFLADPEVAVELQRELYRQNLTIQLIASENYVPEAVLEAQGSVIANKIAEGYPGKRYYGGCKHLDIIEDLAINRAKDLFKAPHANVQSHSGVNANLAVFAALINPGDTILGMNLSQGGHLSHGSKVSITGKHYRGVSYGLHPETELIDYDEVRQLAKKEKPRIIVAGGTAYSRVIDFQKFREIADEVNAFLLVDMAHIAGLVAGDVHPSPMPYADVVSLTTNKTLRGARGAAILCREQYAQAIDKGVFPGVQGSVMPHNIAGKAVTFRLAMTEEFKKYARQVVDNSRALCERLQYHGFRIISGGTDNHLMLVDLRNKGITGKEAEAALEAVGIATNKNQIPNDPQGPLVASGIRLGSAAMTSRGFKTAEMEFTADIIAEALSSTNSQLALEKAKGRVEELCRLYPVYLSNLEISSM